MMVNMQKFSEIETPYSYEQYSASNGAWIVKGPGIYYICNGLNQAREIKALLDCAYLFGYGDKHFEK
jgi:hypothetical protein